MTFVRQRRTQHKDDDLDNRMYMSNHAMVIVLHPMETDEMYETLSCWYGSLVV